jgi:MscS family membrane protein
MNLLRKLNPTVLLVVTLVLLVMLSACGGEGTPAEDSNTITSATLEQTTQGKEATSPPEEGSAESAEGVPTAVLLEAVVSRTPEPTVTPGVVTEAVEELVSAVGLSSVIFLGLTTDQWINLLISIVIIFLGYTLGNLLVRSLLQWVVKRTSTDFDNKFLDTIGNEVRWLVTFITAKFALLRLTFLGETLLAIIDDIIFTIYILIFIRMSLKLLEFAIEYYIGMFEEDLELKPGRTTLILLAKRAGAVVIVILYVAILLDHFGINITGLAAALGIAGLAFSLAAQDTISDAISGVIIMLDQPFRVGDRIEIDELDTWGDVVEIGMRTTKIRTRDNRMVIVPNSKISNNQVVNYTYPDPRYRVQVDIGIGYGQDIENVRKIIHDTVRELPGILEDKSVDVLYNEMGDSSMTFRVRWWIQSYEDTRKIYDRVNTALQKALDDAGIDMPFITYDINLNPGPGELEQPSQNKEDEE